MYNEMPTLCVYDDFQAGAAYRQLSVVLRRRLGARRPGDVFYLHSRLSRRRQSCRKIKS